MDVVTRKRRRRSLECKVLGGGSLTERSRPICGASAVDLLELAQMHQHLNRGLIVCVSTITTPKLSYALGWRLSGRKLVENEKCKRRRLCNEWRFRVCYIPIILPTCQTAPPGSVCAGCLNGCGVVSRRSKHWPHVLQEVGGTLLRGL